MSWDVARARKVLRSLFDTAVAPCRPLAAPCLSLRRLKRSSTRSRLSRALFPRAVRGVPRRVKPLRADRRCHPCGGLHAGARDIAIALDPAASAFAVEDGYELARSHGGREKYFDFTLNQRRDVN